VRAQPFASYARAGNVRVLRGPWTQAWIDEVTTATEEMKGLVDQVDATSGAFARLAGRAQGGSIAEARLERRYAPNVLPEGFGSASPW
jgi:phage terminase large subunit-like protein